MALGSLPRFMTVLVLAAAAITQAPQRALVAAATTTSSAGDVCEESNLACAEVSISTVTFRSICTTRALRFLFLFQNMPSKYG